MNLMELTAFLTLDSSAFTKGIGVAINAAGKLMSSIISTGYNYNVEMERYMTNFTTMLSGNQKKAEGFVKWMEKFAFVTPFKMQDLAQAGQTLLQFNLTTEQSKTAIQQLGDISLGNAEKFNHLAQIYGKVSSQGKLTAQTMNQMIKAGFNPILAVSQATGKSMEVVREEMSKGKVTIDVLNQAMQYATSEGGMFYNAMANGAKTIEGQLSTLEGKWEGLTGGLIQPFTDQLQSKVLPALIEKLDVLSEKLLGVDDAASLGLPEISESVDDWLARLMAAWTDGNRETDEEVQGYIDEFKTMTGTIKSALQERIDALSGSDDPQKDAKIKLAEEYIEKISQLETDIEEILKTWQGKVMPENVAAELDAKARELLQYQNGVDILLGDYESTGNKIRDAIQARIDSLTASDDPMAGMKITAAERSLDRIDKIQTRITEILSGANGRSLTDSETTELNALATEMAAIAESVGRLSDANITPWEKLADALGTLAVAGIDTVSGWILDIANNWGTYEEKAINFVTNFVSNAKQLYSDLNTVISDVKTAFDVINSIINESIIAIKTLINLYNEFFGIGKDDSGNASNKQDTLIGNYNLMTGGSYQLSGDYFGKENLTGNTGGGFGGRVTQTIIGAGRKGTATYDSTKNIYADIQKIAESAGMVDNLTQSISGMEQAAATADVPIESMVNALTSVEGNSEEFMNITNSLIDLASEGTFASESLSEVSSAESEIDGSGADALADSMGTAKKKTDEAKKGLQDLLSYDGKEVNINVNVVQHRSAGLGSFTSSAFTPGSGKGKRETGLGYVPYNNYPTTLDEGEMVLTKMQAREYRRGNKSGSSSAEIDYERLGNAVASALSGFGIDINGKRAARLMRKQTAIANVELSRAYAMGVGK